MNQRSASERVRGAGNERRSSLAATPAEQSSLSVAALSKEVKRSLVAVLSEDQVAAGDSGPPAGLQKQSYLSKFARSEVKSARSVERAAGESASQPLAARKSCSANNKESTAGSRPSSPPASADDSETQCDTRTGGDKQLPGSRTSKSFCELEVTSQREEPTRAYDTKENNNNEAAAAEEEEEENDGDDQVLPVWPSKMDAAVLKPSLVQHQVYSLKDYSQVAGPTESVASSNVASSGRLLKSMSQDRKVEARSKRMSESILSGMGQGVLFMDKCAVEAARQRNPSVASKLSSNELGAMGPATSVNSLLPPAKSNLNLASESSFGRMRKLFVSPLSLRGGASAGSSSKSSSSYQAPVGSNTARLSFQGGAGMLNKPQHLMHAMYRGSRGPLGSHHARRSPLRQKQKCQKGFRVYGCPLSMANTMYPITCFGRAEIYKQQSVPYILARLCNYIEENSSQLTHEGIFRVSGNARLMEKLKSLFDHLGDAPLESESVDVATSASMLKMYLRELPEPLISTRMNHYFFSLAKKYSSCLAKGQASATRTSDNLTSSGLPEVSSISDTQSSLDRQRTAFLHDLTKLIRKLPIENYNLLKYLACFLHRVALKQQSNKMSAEALGIVFGPNVFRIRSESYKGLKEQDLSNQIMASIIGNYKAIFDCELTDPLGNLIASDESLAMAASKQGASASGSAGPGTKKEGADKRRAKSAGLQQAPADASTSAREHPSQLAGCLKGAPVEACAMAEHEFYAGDSDDDDDDDQHTDQRHQADAYDDDDDADDIDDLDDEHDDCNNSYSPTSGSGSYCSSLASESEESVYEGDIEQYDEEAALDSDSSSRCNSETSYTPSSSHSDSGPEVEDMSSSADFGSSPSGGGGGGGGGKENGSFADQSGGPLAKMAPNPCRVCKRRESRHLEAVQLSKLRDQALLKLGPAGQAEADQEVVEADRVSDGRGEQPDSSGKSRGRASIRKRRSEESKRMASAAAKRDAHSSLTSTHTSSDMALDQQREAGQKARSEDRIASASRQQQCERRPLKTAALRRRSSSVSSLLRLSERHAAQRKRGPAVRDDYRHRSRAHADRKRYTNEPRANSRKSKSRAHWHNVKQQAAADDLQPGGSSSKLEQKQGDYYIPELMALDHLAGEVRKDLVWNYVSSPYFELSETERYYQLRSYNSDETLLRSQEAESQLLEASSKNNRRRFSGHEFLQANQNETLLSAAFPHFGEIFESFEAENSMEESRSVNSNEPAQSLFDRSQMTAVKSSAISLLEEQMTNFEHSTLSLNENEDPIFVELRVSRDFIRVLRSLLKHGCMHGFDQEAANYLNQVVGQLGPDSDDCASLYVDHITGKRTVATLENLKRDLKDDKPRVDRISQERLERLLSFTITNLKKRYNNLKYIRDHYSKHHANSAGSLSRDGRPNVADEAKAQETKAQLCVDPGSATPSGSDTTREAAENERPPAQRPEGASDQQAAQGAESTMASCSTSCKYGTLCPAEFVFNMEKQLASKRVSGLRLVKLDDMTLAQIQSEKLELQKNLLRYEHWFGRPTTRAEFDLVGHLYERYRAIKIIKQRKQASAE